MMKKLKKGMIIFLGVCIYLNVNEYRGTRNVQAYNSQTEHINMKIKSATPKKIRVKIINKEDDIVHYAENYKLYKLKKGKWKKIKIVSPMPKTLYPLEGKDSATHTIACKRIFGEKLSKGNYKLKWIQNKKFSIK